MSKATFQAKLNLISVTPLNVESTEWTCDVQFTDYDGAFTGMDISIGDVVAVDTSGVEAGSFTLFDVFAITNPDMSTPTISLRYMAENDNMWGPPDLSAFMNNDCVISRPSDNYGLLPVVSRDLQLISDKFTEYVQNYNFSKIVDNVNMFRRQNGDTVTLTRGMVVYMAEANNTMLLAHGNDTIERARAAGVVMTTTPVGTDGVITCDGTVEQSTDAWDALTGSTGGLLPSKAYFLHGTIEGGISHIPPTGGFITRVGRALSSTAFDVNLEAPIML